MSIRILKNAVSSKPSGTETASLGSPGPPILSPQGVVPSNAVSPPSKWPSSNVTVPGGVRMSNLMNPAGISGAVIRSAVPRQPRYSNPAVTAAAALAAASTTTRPSLPKATADKGQIQPTPPKQSVSRQQVWSLSTSQPANVLPTSTVHSFSEIRVSQNLLN